MVMLVTGTRRYFLEDLLARQQFKDTVTVTLLQVNDFLESMGGNYRLHMANEVRAECGDLIPPDMYPGLFTDLSLGRISRPLLSLCETHLAIATSVPVGIPLEIVEEIIRVNPHETNPELGFVRSKFSVMKNSGNRNLKVVECRMSYLVNRRPTQQT